MGILLPPVSQVTAGPTLTSHHRNRSLDSALQRIPEVDVTPSPECETDRTVVSRVPCPTSVTEKPCVNGKVFLKFTSMLGEVFLDALESTLL